MTCFNGLCLNSIFLEQHPFRPADLDVEALYTRFHQQAMDRSTREMFEGPDGSFDTAREMFSISLALILDSQMKSCMTVCVILKNSKPILSNSIGRLYLMRKGRFTKFGDDSESDPFSDPFEDEIVIEPMHTNSDGGGFERVI